MKQILHTWFPVLLLFGACTPEPIDFESRNPGFLVIDGWITTEPASHEILLTRTAAFGSQTGGEPVENAAVFLLAPNDTIEFENEGGGFYQTPFNFALEPFEKYTFVVDVELESFEYETQLPYESEMQEFEYEESFEKFVFIIEDDDPITRYFIFTYYKSEIEGNDTIWIPLHEKVVEMDLFTLDFSEENFHQVEFSATLITELPAGTLVKTELHAVTPETFHYLEAISEDHEVEFLGHTGNNPPTTFTNGAFGTIITSAVTDVIFER